MNERRWTDRRTRPVLSALVLALCLVALATLGSVTSAEAKIFRADTSRDRDDAVPGDGKCADAKGKCTLRAGVQEANALPGPDRLKLRRGAYRLTGGQLEVGDGGGKLTIIGKGPFGEGTAIDGLGKDRVFLVDAGSLKLRTLFVRGGLAPFGAGILIEAGSDAEIARVRLLQNVATEGGKPLRKRRGGSIFQSGGGVLVLDAARFTSRASEIQNNKARGSGGGLAISGGSADLHNTRIHANLAYERGGAIALLNDVFCRGCTERSDERGVNFRAHELRILRSSITSNASQRGSGGIWGNDAEVRLSQSTVAENQSTTNSGRGRSPSPAIDLFDSDFHAANSTIAFNSGPSDLANDRKRSIGGLTSFDFGRAANLMLSDSDGTIFNTIIAEGRLGGVLRNCGTFSSNLFESLGFNLSDDASCGLPDPTDLEEADPALADPERLGSRTEVIRVFPSGDAFDSGPAECGRVDQRFEPRPAGAACERGSYEDQG